MRKDEIMRKIASIAVSITLVILLILPIMPVSAMASFITDITENDDVISGNIIKDIELEEKIICDATIDD